MNIHAAHEWRFACKAFDANKKIPEADIASLLEVIRLSPSSFGLQPFQVIIIQNPLIREKLKATVWGAQKQLPTASHFLLFVTREDITHDSEYVRNMIIHTQKTPEDLIDFRLNLIKGHQQKDATLLDNSRYLRDWAGKQAYIALGNVMTAAAELGIDSCPIEGFDFTETTELLAEEKVIDPQTQAICVFCALGYRLDNPAREKVRQPAETLFSWV